MKTAISIDDELLHEADETARLMGLTRSRLIALAVDEYLKRQRGEQIVLKLNQVYGGNTDAAPEKRLLKGLKTTFSRTIKDAW